MVLKSDSSSYLHVNYKLLLRIANNMNLLEIFLKTLRKVYMKASSTKKEQVKKIELEFTGQNASHVIREKLLSPEPCMIARFGNNELKIVLEYQNSYQQWKYIKYVTGKITTYKINESTFQSAYNNAGIFPSNEETLGKFAKLMLEDMKEIDVLHRTRPAISIGKDMVPYTQTKFIMLRNPGFHAQTALTVGSSAATR